jgi:hypothetical protein
MACCCMRVALVGLVSFGLLLPAESVAQARPDPAVVAGCYRLTLGAWSPPLRAQDWPASQTPPQRFELDTTALPLWLPKDTVWAVRPASLVPRARMPATWRYISSDSIAIVWSTGFTGVHLGLRIVRDTLQGLATTFHDAHIEGEPPDPRASAVAVRDSCAVGEVK